MDRLALGRQIYDYFLGRGLAPHQAAAVAGNMAWEGGGRTDLVNPGDNWRNSPRSPHSVGIAQWNDRAPALIAFARRQGIDIPQGDLRDVAYARDAIGHIPLGTQLDFAWDELGGPEGRALGAVRGARDLRTATAGAIGYHRPAGFTWANPYAGHGFENRRALAERILRGSGEAAVPGTAASAAPTAAASAVPSAPRPGSPPAGMPPAPIAASDPAAGAPAPPSGPLRQFGSALRSMAGFGGPGTGGASGSERPPADLLGPRLAEQQRALSEMTAGLLPRYYRDGGVVGDAKRIEAALRIAARQTDANPSEEAKKSGRYAKGTFSWHGLKIAIENPVGSTRSGVGKDGRRWSVRMPATYGEILKTEGMDGDPVDAYVGSDHASSKVFVIDQVDAETGKPDEHKVMLSYASRGAALTDYVKAFSDGKGKDRIGGVAEMSVDAFKMWLKSPRGTSKPAASSKAATPVKSYATGGTVMPLPKGNANVGRNIAELMQSGRPQRQSVAIALDVARRRGKASAAPGASKSAGRAYGGRVVDMRGGGRVIDMTRGTDGRFGYADGGEPVSEPLPGSSEWWRSRTRHELDGLIDKEPSSLGNINALKLGAGLGTAAHFALRSRMPIPARGIATGAGLEVARRGGASLLDDYSDMSRAVDARAELRRRERANRDWPGAFRRGGRAGYADGGEPLPEELPVLPPIDWGETGRFSVPIGPPPRSQSPITDAVAGTEGAGLARGTERFLRGVAEGTIHGPPEMVAEGLGNLEGAVADRNVARGVGAIGQVGLGAVSPVLPFLRPFQSAMAARPVLTSVGTGTAFGGSGLLAEAGQASAQTPATQTPPQAPAAQAQPNQERARVLAAEVEQLRQQVEAARQRREAFRPAGGRLPTAQRDPQYTEANAEFNRLTNELSAARTVLKAEMEKGTPEYRAREAAQGDRERQVREAVAERERIRGAAPSPFQEEFGAVGERWPLAPVVAGGLSGLAAVMPRTISQRFRARRWDRALNEAQGIPVPSVMDRALRRTPAPVTPERQATALETARRYADRAETPAWRSYLAGYGGPAGLGAFEGGASAFLPNYYNMINLPAENPEWTALQAEYRMLPEDHPRRAQLKRQLENETELSRRNRRQQQAEEFFSTGRWMPAMGGAAAEGAGAALIGATVGRLARPQSTTWGRMRDDTRAILDSRPPPGPQSPRPPSPSPRPPPPQAGDAGLARLPLPEGGPPPSPPPPGGIGVARLGATAPPRPGSAAAPDTEPPPVPSGQRVPPPPPLPNPREASSTPPSQPPATIPAVRPVRGTDSLGRTFWYNPTTGNRMSAPPPGSRGRSSGTSSGAGPGNRPAEQPEGTTRPRRAESEADRANREAAESLRRRGIVDPDEDGRRYGGAVGRALAVARRYADGGVVARR